jgi:RES domain-containing protein
MKWNTKLVRALFVASSIGAMMLSAMAEFTWG